MSMFHASVREVLEDTYTFLNIALHNELLSTKALASKEDLITKLIVINNSYPQLQLTFQSNASNSTLSHQSPPRTPNSILPPYVDMHGVHTKRDLKVNEENYEPCTNNENLNESEENPYSSNTNWVSNFPPIAAMSTNEFEKFGYLEKKGKERLKGLIKSSQQRWYAIKEGIMYYYDKPSDIIQKGAIPLTGYEAHPLRTKDKKNHFCFELVCPGRRTYQFVAVSSQDMEQWIVAVERNGKSNLKSSAHIDNSSNIQRNDTTDNDTYEFVDDKDNVSTESKFKEVTTTNEDSKAHNSLLEYKNMYVGLWDCQSSDKDELSFHQGDVIHVLSKEYDDYSWWIGELHGKVGFVPKSYLMEAYKSF